MASGSSRVYIGPPDVNATGLDIRRGSGRRLISKLTPWAKSVGQSKRDISFTLSVNPGNPPVTDLVLTVRVFPNSSAGRSRAIVTDFEPERESDEVVRKESVDRGATLGWTNIVGLKRGNVREKEYRETVDYILGVRKGASGVAWHLCSTSRHPLQGQYHFRMSVSSKPDADIKWIATAAWNTQGDAAEKRLRVERWLH